MNSMKKRGIGFALLIVVIVLMISAVPVYGQGNRGGNGQPTGQNSGGTGNGQTTGRGNGYGGSGSGGQQPGQQNGPQNGSGLHLNLPPASAVDLPQDIIELMIAGWTDEQHAYAVYSAVIEQFGAVRPFVNIQKSEAQHIAAWEMLLNRYAITIPDVPVFDVPEFASLTEACAIGASAETANFDLYDSMLTAFEPYPDLLYVAQTLRDASEFNHLPAFENCAG